MRHSFIPLLVVALLAASGAAAQARDATAADARRQISMLNDQISDLQGKIIANNVLILADVVAIAAAQKKIDDRSVLEADKPRGALLALQIGLAALQANESSLEADLAAKKAHLGKWQDYLQSLGG